MFLHIARAKGLQTQVSILEGLIPKDRKKEFVRQWQRNVDRVRIYREHSVNGFGDMEDEENPTESCGKPFEQMGVYWDGKVGLCNHDWDNRTWLGDLNTDTVDNVWLNYNYKRVRALHQIGERRQVASCQECCFSNKLYGELYNGRQK